MYNKKGISVIVAVSLLLIVVVVAVVGFQNWFTTFESILTSDIETTRSEGLDGSLDIEMVDNDFLYVVNNIEDNLSVKNIKIGDKLCNISNNLTIGVNHINISSCINITEDAYYDVILITEKKVVESSLFLEEFEKFYYNCTLDEQVVEHGNSYSFYKYDKPYNNLDGCSAISQQRTCNDGTLNGSSDYDIASCSDSLAPTQGGEWVLVFGNPTLGTTDFYVMKYEAKWNGSGNIYNNTAMYCGDGTDYNLTTGCSIDGSIGVVSEPQDLPLTQVNQFEAIKLCKTLGPNYHLITDKEWITIAKNVETISSNWADDNIGSTIASGGGLKRGNVGYKDSASYNGDDPESGLGRNKTALLNLTNGEGIWDFSGNVWEWTNNSIDCSSGYPCDNLPQPSNPDWHELTSLISYGSFNYNLLRPSNNTWNSSHAVGNIYNTNENSVPSDSSWNNIHSTFRGGTWKTGLSAGVYSIIVYYGPSYSRKLIGFRCSYEP